MAVAIGKSLSKTFKGTYPREPHSIVDKRQKVKRKADVAVKSAFNEFAGVAAMYNAKMKQLRVGAEHDPPAS